MAASKVFGISELLEMILLELPFFDLLRATGINHSFRECIKSSSKLQEKLFLKQTPIGPYNYTIKPSVNPALERLVDITPKGWPPGGETKLKSQMCISTQYTDQGSNSYIPHESKHRFQADIVIETFGAVYHLARQEKERVEESWRNMYFTNMPCESSISIALVDFYSGREADEQVCGSDARVDDVIDVFKRLMETEPDPRWF